MENTEMEPSSSLNEISSENGADGGSDDQPTAARSFTRMDVVFLAAEAGEIKKFNNCEGAQLESLRTPNDNTVLHVHLATGNELLSDLVVLCRRGRWILVTNGVRVSVVQIGTWQPKTSFVQQILDKCPSLLLLPNAKGQTPLHIAARYGHSAIVRFLINHQAKSSHGDRENQRNKFEAVWEMLRKTDKESNTALHVAVERGHLQVVKELLELEDPDFPYSANRNQETPLYIAARRGYHSLLTTILHKFKSPAHGGPHGRTALHAAVMAQDKMATRIILEKKGNWTMETDENGQTPLHYAAHIGWHPVVRDMLKENQSAAYVADKKLEMTPLLMAARQGHVQTIREIVSRCPGCCEMVDKKGWNLFHYMALRDRRPEILFSDIISIRDLRDQEDARGITPRQVFDAFRDGLTVEKMASLRHTKIMEQIATLFEDIKKDEVAEVPVRWFQHYAGYSFGGTLEKIKDSHLLVATLIATVTFAAAITVPGGYKSDNSNSDAGTPFLIRRAAFIAFSISNALAFMFSLAGVAVHFVTALPFKRIPKNHALAMASLYIYTSLLGVAIAFNTATFAVLQPSLWLAVVSSCCIGLATFFCFYVGIHRIYPFYFKWAN